MTDRKRGASPTGAMARCIVLALAFHASPVGSQQLDCGLEGGLKAIAGRAPVSLLFRNPSTHPRRLYWIDFQGHRTPYGTIAPGAERKQQSSYGNHWVVTDDTDRCIAIYEAPPSAATFVIPTPGGDMPAVVVEPGPAVVAAPTAKGPVAATRADAQRPGPGDGGKFGRKPKLTPHQRPETVKRRDVFGETLRSIGRAYNVSAQTIGCLPA